MKKITVFLLAVVMVLSVFGTLNAIAPLKVAAESTNLALNKPVSEDLGDCVEMGDPYWNLTYINDGKNLDNIVWHWDDALGAVVDTPEYGWYVVKQNTVDDPMNASAIIDLGSVYSVCRIKIFTEYHFLGLKFPNTYDVYVSADGTNWTRVCGEAGRTGHLTHAREFEFDKIDARYVKVTIVKGNDVVADDDHPDQYAGIGEIEVYDTYTSGNIAKFKTASQTVDAGVTTWVLGNSGQWDIDAIVGPSVPYAFVPYNMTGWIAVAQTAEAPMKLTVDLHGVYNINKINILPMPWSDAAGDNGWFMPNTYDVLVSEDGANWTKVYHGENESAAGTAGVAREISISTIKAQYVVIDITKGTDHRDQGDFWTGIGGIEVYGEYAVEEPVVVEGLRDFDDSKDKQYFDAILVDGEIKANRANGDAEIESLRNNIDGTNGEISQIGLYGWFASGSAIDKFGYIIDGGEPVYGDFEAPYNSDAEKDTIEGTLAGGRRYNITVDVSGLKDGKAHEITAVAKLANGEIVRFNRPNREAVVTYLAPRTTPAPATADASMVIFIVAAAAIALIILKKKAF